ncbi:aminopeptidase P N-terminal domain-containing protein [Ostreibacterium oceani]|uniref:Xaa-Pro aminopeptidase n=1 Tax=Ostreibacterium oceani TaxID=2654998 RepID=A0A6N7ES91_9GAMM|nr:aminopeptidase P N-terminal domain-containing protein [Ostreibacterium oceani]MPV85362.1 M24 family metallopeptidase [Ostreibacterium oceani]
MTHAHSPSLSSLHPTTPMTVFKSRRDRLLKAIGEAILVLPVASEAIRNRDVYHAFRQDSDFLYLSYFLEPNAVLVLDGKTQQSTLFSRPLDELHAIWEGDIIGQQRAQRDYLFDASDEIARFDAFLLEQCYLHDTLIMPFSRYADFDSRVLTIIEQAKATRRARAPQQLLHSDQFIHPMRLIKDEYEIAAMQHAADISIEAHKALMQQTQPGQYEYQLAARLDYQFRHHFGVEAYGHIVASGNNACTLHYRKNNALLRDGDLLLVDAGCEYHGYAADITRTFPVNGRFTQSQAAVYQWVLTAMEAALAAAKPGNSIRSPHEAATHVLIEGMLALGLVSGTAEQVYADKTYQRYFMHGTSHWLGIDVHDVGDYKTQSDEDVQLQPGMALTIEPGLYIRADDESAPEALRGIGIRIEDDVIITPDGHLNLTGATPKSIDAIEACCADAAREIN